MSCFQLSNARRAVRVREPPGVPLSFRYRLLASWTLYLTKYVYRGLMAHTQSPRIQWHIVDATSSRIVATVAARSERGALAAHTRSGGYPFVGRYARPVESLSIEDECDTYMSRAATVTPAGIDWEEALLGEPYAHGMCTILDCGAPATHTDPAWAASGHEPYRCPAHAQVDVHVLASPVSS